MADSSSRDRTVPVRVTRKYPDLLTGLILFGLTAAVFLPVFNWLAAQTISRDQIQYSVLILSAALAVTLWRERRSIVFRFKLGRGSLGWVAAAYLAGALALLIRSPLPLFLGFLLAFVGATIFLIGEEHLKLTLRLALGFAIFLGIVILFPLLDLPLRKLAGAGAAGILESIGYQTQIGLVGDSVYPQVILMVDGMPFNVATECNGFGLITSCALLALLVVLTGREKWPWKAVLVFSGALIGMILNIARIVVICLLAPKLPDHYTLMHEVVGTLALWLGVGLTWWIVSPSGPAFLQGRQKSPPAVTT